jgi:hypothetical protein
MSKHRSVYSNINPGDGDDEGDCGKHHASFSLIFAFTHKKHLVVLILALVLTTVAGAIKPAITVFLGRIFDELANFNAGSITGDELHEKVSTWCIALTGLGIATMLVNGGFFSLWMVFGEMQARSVRDMAFLSLQKKDIEWYDLRVDGIGSLLVRIQTYVTLDPNTCVLTKLHEADKGTSNGDFAASRFLYRGRSRDVGCSGNCPLLFMELSFSHFSFCSPYGNDTRSHHQKAPAGYREAEKGPQRSIEIFLYCNQRGGHSEGL